MSNEDKGTLVMGTVYYDSNTKILNHDVRFPEKENWVNADTSMYRFRADTLVSKQTTGAFGEFSIYGMILSQQITDFGLSKGGYTLSAVDETGDGNTISTWTPVEQLKNLLGNVIIMQENKRISAVAFYDAENAMQGKFYFKEYQIVDGLAVPGKIYQKIYTKEGAEHNRIISFTNIIINEDGSDQKYNFRVPAP